MELNADVCYRIIQARDARFDGTFFTGVTSTGIYCRPICPARTPRRENVKFYACAASAEAAGFRPCRRCRPETAPGTPAWNGTMTTVSHAVRLIANGFLDEHSMADLAALLGLGERHVRRLFIEHLGAAPGALAQSRRAHFAARMLRETDVPVSQVAFGAGFGSIRQFNDVMRSLFGEPPSSLRRSSVPARKRRERDSSSAAVRTISFSLAYRPPFQWDAMLSFFRKRAVRGVEEVTDRSYRRSIAMGGSSGILEVSESSAGANAVDVSISGLDPVQSGAAVRRVKRMFDLDSDPLAIARHVRQDERLAHLIDSAPGMRIPGTWDPFEALLRAVLGQQISVAGAITIAGRLCERFGRRIENSGTISTLFPGPAELAEADFSGMGVPSARARTIRAAAHAVLAGDVHLDGYLPRNELEEELTSLPGIGPWSARYVALRGFGEPDAFPEADLGIQKALDSLRFPADRRQRHEALERLAPWRGYVAIYLWNMLSQGG